MKENRPTLWILSLCVACSACTVSSQTTVPLERREGERDVIINCPFTNIQAIPTWIIGGTIYYITRLPPQFIQLQNGDLKIIVIDSSLNHTTLQCIVPSENQNRVSDITLLIVTEGGDFPVVEFDSRDELPQLVIDHQRSDFRENSYLISWNTLNNNTCINYQMNSTDCDPDQNIKLYLNGEPIKNITLNSSDLTDDGNNLQYFNISVSDSEEEHCFSISERFQIDVNATTIEKHTVLSSRRCATCVNLPPENNQRGTPYIALPVASNKSVQCSPDLFCPLNIFTADNCVNLRDCDNFNRTLYNETLTICKNDSLKMCFQNFPRELNKTKVFMFYLNPQCNVNGMLYTTRIYIMSYEFFVEEEHGNFSVSVSDQKICLSAEQSDCHFSNETLFMVTVTNPDGCELYRNGNVLDSSCITTDTLLLVDCFPLILEIRAENPAITYQSEKRTLNKAGNAETTCDCLKSQVVINIKSEESNEPETTINLQFTCNSSICDRILKLILQTENKTIREFHVNCSTTSVPFEGLECGTNYSIVASQALPGQAQTECILSSSYAVTESCGEDIITVNIAVVVSFVSVILLIGISVMATVVLLLWYRRNLNKKKDNATKPEELPLGDTNNKN